MRFCFAITLALAALAQSSLASTQAPVLKVAPGIAVISGQAAMGTQPDGNSVVISAPDGLIVIDTGRHPAHTQQVIDFAHATHQPVRAIINTHWHLDHVGGNALVRASFPGVEVYASDAIRGALDGFLADYRKQLETALATESKPSAAAALHAEVALIDSRSALLPTQVIAASAPRVIADRPLQLFFEKAATAGDIWVFDEKSRVLIAGDIVTLPAPFFDTACADRWQAALARLAQQPFRILIPGHGAPMQREAFENYRRAFDRLLSCSRNAGRSKNDCTQGWLDDSTALVQASDRAYAQALVGYYLDGMLKGEPAKQAELCAG